MSSYLRLREAKVPAQLAGSALDAVVRALFALSWGKAREMIARGKVSVDGTMRDDPLVRTKEGQLVAYQHESFWKCMDTLRDKQELSRLWANGEARWKA